MARAIIRVVLTDTTDDKAIEIKKKIEQLVKDVEGAEIELNILAR